MKTKILEVVTIDLEILKSKPPILVISALGNVPSSGWSAGELIPYIYIAPPVDGIYEFAFVAEPPSVVSADVITPVEATFVWPDFPDTLKGVRIYAKNNDLVKTLGRETVTKAVDGGGGEFPRALFYSESSQANITFNAFINNIFKPLLLHVHGSIMTYRDDDTVKISKSVPQGFNPAILLLNLEVSPGKGPKKGSPKSFYFHEESTGRYTHVTIRYGLGQSLTKRIEIVE